jgi:hypothetical protein
MLPHTSLIQTIGPISILCVDLTINYSCPHKETSLYRCNGKECKTTFNCVETLQTTCEHCKNCRQQEEANRDAALARLTKAHAADEQAVQELRARLQELERDRMGMEALTQERDELAQRLDIIEGEAVAELREILLEDIDSRLDVLAVEQAEFMRQVDEQNAVAELAMLELEEQVRIMLPEDEEENALP